MRPCVRPRRLVAASALLLSLASCAGLKGFAPDPAARAPTFSGFGQSSIAITASNERARRLFNEGVLQAYAFNEVEAVRTFKAALTQDPDCAMCAWGVAWQLGPNINDTDRDNVAEAIKYVDYALGKLRNATPRERALVEALAVRYAHASTARETAPLTGAVCGNGASDDEKANPLDVAYADRMRAMAARYPDDPDVLSLYAEAEMIATPGNESWKKDGRPVGHIGEVADRIEALLPRHLAHTGLNHYMIHIVDAAPVAQRAVAAADRLGTLAPNAPHLVHMPAHIYVHVGRYDDAMRVNSTAVQADVTLAGQQAAQGFTVSKDWRGHNQHFLWYAAIMAGREDEAMAAAAGLGEQVKDAKNTFGEYVRSLPLVTLVRFEQWDKVLQQPRPEGDRGIAQTWYEYARGVAHARLGRIDEAQASLQRLQAVAPGVRAAYPKDTGQQKRIRAQLDMADAGLQSEIGLARKQYDEAIVQQARMLEAARSADSLEPPLFADGTRVKLGELQLRAGRFAEAEATFREALKERPGSPWATRGLARATQQRT